MASFVHHNAMGDSASEESDVSSNEEQQQRERVGTEGGGIHGDDEEEDDADDDDEEEEQGNTEPSQEEEEEEEEEEGQEDEDMPDASPRAEVEEDDEDEDDPEKSSADGGDSKGVPQEFAMRKTTNAAAEEDEDDEEEEEEDDDEGQTTENAPEEPMEGGSAVDGTTGTGSSNNNKPEIGSVYSTRSTADHEGDIWDALAINREGAPGELPSGSARDQPPSAAALLGASFLSESFTEEERRTRTRYLPDVEGFDALRKHEVKSDLALARAVLSSSTASSASASTNTNKKKRGREDDGSNKMDMDDVSVASSDNDEDRSSSDAALRANAKVIPVGRNDYALPPTAFVAPDLARSSISSSQSQKNHVNPNQVDATTAFNPPRPPESVGPKKKHRMMRWEQHPASIEVDLQNYKKTVTKTRQELKNAQNEHERIMTVDHHMRRHLLAHLQALDDEVVQLNNALQAVQQECVESADLLTSRTRSRGNPNNKANVMRDVLTVLRSRGAEMTEKKVTFDTMDATPSTGTLGGVGGLGPLAFEDWDCNTKITTDTAPAARWIVPGDRVQTPEGMGTVKAVSLPSDSGSEANDQNKGKGTALLKGGPPRIGVQLDSEKDEMEEDKGDKEDEGDNQSDKVRYFALEDVKSLENPRTYSDARLAQRWKGIVETTAAFGPFLDVEGMQGFLPWDEPERPDLEAMDMDNDDANVVEEDQKRPRLLPVGCDMLPTHMGRGAGLHEADVVTLDKQLHKTLYDGVGVLGDVQNPGVPTSIRELEDKKERFIRAKARSLQLTNALIRQRRITKLNERTLQGSIDRTARAEALVTEMKSDLGSLKRRLDEEIVALGLDEATVREILTAFYEQ
jgi:hypothetical protein